MTAHIAQEIQQAAAFVQRHHHDLPIDDLAMSLALHTLRAAGVWSLADINLPAIVEPPKVSMEMRGTFCAGDRKRVVYRLMADGQEIGTAVCWTNKTAWPWGLTIASANIVNFGFKSREDLLRAVEHFAKTGELV